MKVTHIACHFFASLIPPKTLQALLNHNAKVYIAARTQSRAESAISELKEATGKEALFLKLDLADLKSVKAAAEEYTRYVFSSNLYYLRLTSQ